MRHDTREANKKMVWAMKKSDTPKRGVFPGFCDMANTLGSKADNPMPTDIETSIRGSKTEANVQNVTFDIQPTAPAMNVNTSKGTAACEPASSVVRVAVKQRRVDVTTARIVRNNMKKLCGGRVLDRVAGTLICTSADNELDECSNDLGFARIWSH